MRHKESRCGGSPGFCREDISAQRTESLYSPPTQNPQRKWFPPQSYDGFRWTGLILPPTLPLSCPALTISGRDLIRWGPWRISVLLVIFENPDYRKNYPHQHKPGSKQLQGLADYMERGKERGGIHYGDRKERIGRLHFLSNSVIILTM